VRVELSQRGGDGGRLIGQFVVTHSVATVVTDVVLQRPVCHVAQVRPDGRGRRAPRPLPPRLTVFVGSGEGRVRAAGRSWSGFPGFFSGRC
jgi:hypothetical protein